MQIRTPKGIRFDCSGCGNCCLHWPVPITARDYDKINMLSDGGSELRTLRSSRENLLRFTHTLEKRADGRCQFLTAENRCQLHLEHGEDAKPSMCSLFPYTFTIAPDTVRASLSFASSAVLYNSGKLLSEQEETVEKQFKRFSACFDIDISKWERLQILDGMPLSFESFSKFDQETLTLLESDLPAEQFPRKMKSRLQTLSKKLIQQLPHPSNAEREPKLESRPKIVDQLLLRSLDLLYFPDDVFCDQSYDLNARELMRSIVSAPDFVCLGKQNPVRFSELAKTKLGRLPEQVEELIDRFLYMKLFSRLYFGPGFHHLSLISGIHHLLLLEVLIRLRLKEKLLTTRATEIDFDFAAEQVRKLERRITQLDLSKESVSILEILTSSPERAARIQFFAD